MKVWRKLFALLNEKQTKTYDKMTYLSRFIFVHTALDEKCET